MERAVELALPVTGTWLAQNSPARRVPSHGTHLFATTYAIDLVAVRGRRTATARDGRTFLGTEPPERFHAFGLPVLAPAAGTVVAVHDGEPDHGARRSPVALLGYALTQAARARGGHAALAGNHVVYPPRRGRVRRPRAPAGGLGARPAGRGAGPGRRAGRVRQLGQLDAAARARAGDGRADATTARGVPLVFRDYHERERSGRQRVVARGVPAERSVGERA